MKNALIKTSDFINKIAKALVTYGLMLCFVMIFYQVFSRYVLQSPILSQAFPDVNWASFSFAWLEEGVRFLYVWITFVGVTIVTYNRSHARVQLMTENLPISGQTIMNLLSDLLCLFYFILNLVLIITLIFTTATQRSPLLKISMKYMYYSMVFTFPICVIHMIRQFVEDDIKLLKLFHKGGQSE